MVNIFAMSHKKKLQQTHAHHGYKIHILLRSILTFSSASSSNFL